MTTTQEYISLSFSVSLAHEEELQGYFLMNYDVQGFEEGSDGSMIIHLLKEEWTTEADTKLAEFLAAFAKDEVILLETISQKNTDWNAAWEASIEPLQITDDLVIAPSWRLDTIEKDSKHLIVVDPKMSFGTGHHETTRLCLAMLERIDCSAKNVLDLGSGTGILAMYAMMRGAKHAVAVDTDEWAFNNAKENCERNNFGPDKIEIRMGDVRSAIKPEEKFDLVLANIHRNILLDIHSDLALHQSSSDMLILSGILQWDADEIIAAYEKSGYHLKEKKQENEWICLLMNLA